jgi:hypothetical protein
MRRRAILPHMRRRIYLIVFGVILLTLTGALLFHSNEPSYEGHTLSEWMELWVTNSPNPGVSFTTQKQEEERLKAIEAIRQIGPKSVPFLLRWIDYEPPDWNIRLQNHLQSASHGKNALGQHIIHFLEKPSVLKKGSGKTFFLLGPTAEDAAPGLAKLLDSPKPGVANDARLMLTLIGPKGLPPLLVALTNQSRTDRSDIAISIGGMGSNGRPAIPLLVRCLKENSHGRNADFSLVIALQNLKADPADVVPALTDFVADPKRREKFSIRYLGNFGAAASNALPVLRKAMEDRNEETSQAAWNAIVTINRALEKTPQ